jgi:preprotein translocase subunit SecG
MKKTSLITIALLSTLLLTPLKADARGFGFEDSIETEYIGAGLCLTRTTTTLYIFWIPVQTTVEETINPC